MSKTKLSAACNDNQLIVEVSGSSLNIMTVYTKLTVALVSNILKECVEAAFQTAMDIVKSEEEKKHGTNYN